MGNGSVAGRDAGHSSSGTVAWGLLLIGSAAGLWIGRRRSVENAS
jgi:LPXTG-motif cell wall-anchored protein